MELYIFFWIEPWSNREPKFGMTRASERAIARARCLSWRRVWRPLRASTSLLRKRGKRASLVPSISPVYP